MHFRLLSALFLAAGGPAGTLYAQAPTAAATTYRFDFGPGKTAKGYTRVLPGATYTAGGYGFDFGTTVQPVRGKGKNRLTSDGVTSHQPFYFSVALPEGNYNVTVTLGDQREASATTLKAESRRLLWQAAATEPGEFTTRTFTVNRKDRRIGAQDSVLLNRRELTKLDWDDKLTLEFDGPATHLRALEITPAREAVTVFLAGNSTAANQEDEPWAAWGQMLPRFFKPGVAVANHAEAGLALSSFQNSRRLEKVLSVMKPGDYLLIEFGHNDQRETGPNAGAYKLYTERLRYYIRETIKKGGTPVLVTSTSRRSFNNKGKLTNSLGDFPAAVRKVAREDDIPLIDLNALTTSLYEALGPEESKKAFVHYPANTYPDQPNALADNTHCNPYGAYETARCLVAGIKASKLALAELLLDDLPDFDPAYPDSPDAWHWPASPRRGSELVN